MNMEDVQDTLSEKKIGIYSTLDLKSGFWQVKLDPETAHKTAYVTHESILNLRVSRSVHAIVVSFSHN